ncbi:MAG TPA: hypothetical protein VF116_00705 [Ktedonobacterales bacterium]
MSRTLSITLPDAEYEALRAAAARAGLSPEALAAGIVRQNMAVRQLPTPATPAARPAEDPVLAIMRARGHLEDPAVIAATMPSFDDLPPRGSPEEAKLLEEIGQELSDALEEMGLTINDLVERR